MLVGAVAALWAAAALWASGGVVGALVMTVARVVVPIMAVAVATTRLGTVAKSGAAQWILQAMTKKGRQPCMEIDVELRVAPDVVEGF